jgi:diguanylate cyclase (GGDEF)-like protein
MQSIDFNELLTGIDNGIDAHLAWNQRLLRCALLRESPGNDVLLPNAHELCQFGIWFTAQRAILDEIDAPLIARIDDAHRCMHDGVRSLAVAVLEDTPAQPADLQLYQDQQTRMVNLLHALRQRIVDIDSHHDSLTGLPMRHSLEHAFTIRQRDAMRSQSQLWLALADIDHFKSVNDTYGHSVGDMAIKHAAQCLALCLRTNDILFRYGGEEFLGLFLLESGSDIRDVAKRMLHSVQAPLFLGDNQSLHMTVTIGLASVSSGETLRTVIDRADFALLDGKKAGRNRYIIANEIDVSV